MWVLNTPILALNKKDNEFNTKYICITILNYNNFARSPNVYPPPTSQMKIYIMTKKYEKHFSVLSIVDHLSCCH